MYSYQEEPVGDEGMMGPPPENLGKMVNILGGLGAGQLNTSGGRQPSLPATALTTAWEKVNWTNLAIGAVLGGVIYKTTTWIVGRILPKDKK